MSYKMKVCQRCGKEYPPTNGRQRYCAECSAVELLAYMKVYRAKNRDRINASNRASRLAHYDATLGREHERKATRAEFYAARPDKAKARGKNEGWSKANPEKASVAYLKWKREHLDQLRIRSVVTQSKRRALKYANTPLDEMLTSTEWLGILADANGHCAYCGREAKFTLDHVIPLSKGGKHSKDNVVAACGHCNFSKGRKTVEEWVGMTVP